MLRQQETTPCPGVTSLDQFRANRRSRDSLISIGEETTANIDFTTEFRASIRNVAPRRRRSVVGLEPKRRNVGVTFSIHEDEEVKSFPPPPEKTHSPTLRTSVLAQPAQRFKPRVSFVAPQPTHDEQAPTKWSHTSTQGSMPSEAQKDHTSRDVATKEVKTNARTEIKKPARRGTLYIPSEDTTVPSIFMGVFSPIKNMRGDEGGDHAIGSQMEMTGIAAQMAQKKSSRKSLAAEPPKRVPFQVPTRSVQETTLLCDIPGQGIGKENLPPGYKGKETEKKQVETNNELFDVVGPLKSRRASLNPAHVRRRSFIPPKERGDVEALMRKQDQPARRSSLRLSVLPEPQTDDQSSMLRRVGPRKSMNAQPGMRRNEAPLKVYSQTEVAHTNYLGCENSMKPTHETHQALQSVRPKPERIPEKLLLPQIGHTNIAQQYPLLKEDISQPSLYEDSWLSHQEAAIMQLVNNLFSAAKGSDTFMDHTTLRSIFIRLYQDPSIVLLQKRIQAALLYGALSIPKDMLLRGSRIFEDIGMRRRFLDLWTTTYDLEWLPAAAESVFGRECCSTLQNPNSGSANGPTRRSSKKSVDQFLEVFLLRNQDAKPDGSLGWCYQRTILRSLLLILLLDQARTSSEIELKICLFQSTSMFKSSQSVLEAFATMLMPFSGDVVRPLSHLNYSLRHVQYPLEEYEYFAENLAVDLRDGVRLTRLVELLLYPSASHLLQMHQERNATTTIAMPTGEILSLTDGEQDWPLSQHLKFPCLGRATKLFNTQIALSALAGVKGISNVIKEIKAEDIVDGYREKTVALLWALVSKWGLGELMDWSDLRREILRLERRAQITVDEDYESDDEDDQPLSPGKQKRLLKRWAAVIGSKRGLQVNNMSTSFADGKVFAAIIDEYSAYLYVNPAESSARASLEEKLIALGCSHQFASIFSNCDGSIHGHIFDRDFVFASLAFLGSRLLSTSKFNRASTIIQRCWRSKLQRRALQKRIVAARIARDCVAVVNARERLLWAKTTILHHWRERQRRRPRLMRTVGQRYDKPMGSEVNEDLTGDIWLAV